MPDLLNDGYRFFDVQRMWLSIRLLFLSAISPVSGRTQHDVRQRLMDDQYQPVDSAGDYDHCSMNDLPSLADQELVLQLVGLPHFSQNLYRSMQCTPDDDEHSKGRLDPQQQLQRDWSSTTSLGEKQRIAVARVLLHHPKLVTFSLGPLTLLIDDVIFIPNRLFIAATPSVRGPCIGYIGRGQQRLGRLRRAHCV